MIFADVRLPRTMGGVLCAKVTCTLWPTIRIVPTSGDLGAVFDDLPDCVTFVPDTD